MKISESLAIKRSQPTVMTSADKRSGLILWGKSRAMSYSRSLSETEDLSFMTNIPFGYSAIIGYEHKVESVPSAIIQKILEKPLLIKELAPPFCLIKYNKNGEFLLVNDMRGLSEVFTHSNESLSIWTNNITMGAIFSDGPASLDEEAIGVRAIYSYFPRCSTVLSGFKRVAGGTVIFRGRDKKIKTFETGAYHKLFSQNVSKDYSRNSAKNVYLDSLERTLNESKSFFGANLSLGLTGGRDSRLLLAGLIELGRHSDVCFYTLETISQELEVTHQIIAKMRKKGVNLNWRSISLKKDNYEKMSNKYFVEQSKYLKSIDERNPLIARDSLKKSPNSSNSRDGWLS